MAVPIQEPDSAVQLTQAFGVKGKLNLQLDEVVVPVHQVGGDGSGSQEGFFSTEATVTAGGAGTGRTTVLPYNLLNIFTSGGKQDPSPATHRIWLMGVSVLADAPAAVTDFVIHLALPLTPPEYPILLSSPILMHGVAADATAVATAAGDVWYAPSAKSYVWPLPAYLPPDCGVTLAALFTGAGNLFHELLFWTGPKGTTPPFSR